MDRWGAPAKATRTSSGTPMTSPLAPRLTLRSASTLIAALLLSRSNKLGQRLSTRPVNEEGAVVFPQFNDMARSSLKSAMLIRGAPRAARESGCHSELDGTNCIYELTRSDLDHDVLLAVDHANVLLA